MEEFNPDNITLIGNLKVFLNYIVNNYILENIIR